MEAEGKSLVLRLIIYIVFMATCFFLFLKSLSPLVLLLCLLLIISRTVMVVVVLGFRRKRRLPASQDKSK
jgi:Flp pilus assembly protein TadB